jgi:hypothetical protein
MFQWVHAIQATNDGDTHARHEARVHNETAMGNQLEVFLAVKVLRDTLPTGSVTNRQDTICN